MKNIFKSLIVLCAFISAEAMAVGTADKVPDQIGIQGLTPDEFVITSLSGWGASGCSGARSAILSSSLNNRDQMLSLIIAAKAADMPIRFYGSCDASNPDRFNATYTIVK